MSVKHSKECKSPRPPHFMQLTKNRKLFQVRYLNREEPERAVYSMKSLRGKFGSKPRTDIEIIECDVVEVGRIAFNDLPERIKQLK